MAYARVNEDEHVISLSTSHNGPRVYHADISWDGESIIPDQVVSRDQIIGLMEVAAREGFKAGMAEGEVRRQEKIQEALGIVGGE